MNYPIFEYPITIKEIDIDENGHVNNISYLKWVQEVAIAHWNSVSNTNMRTNYVWVVSRHEIDYLKSAYLHSNLLAKTWVIEPEGARSQRYVTVYDIDSNTIIAKVITTWYLLDATTKKPKRIEADVISAFSLNESI